MSKKKVYIKFGGHNFDFVEDQPDSSPGSGVSVQIRRGDTVRWKARKDDIKLKLFDGFRVEFVTAAPTTGKISYDSVSESGGPAAETDPADVNRGRYKYKVTLFGPGNPSVDPEVEVVDPGVQHFLTLEAVYDAANSALVCPSEEVFEGDLVRFLLELGELPNQGFAVSFPSALAVYLPTSKDKELHSTPGQNVTFYCQAQPVQHTTEYVYQVGIKEMGVTGEGVITVRPRPEQGSAGA